ncbi:MAG: hypothetical protein VYE81_03055 [Planctomycetota bacterium]|nr:hypothetical protein [Planctomycetota bacterium]
MERDTAELETDLRVIASLEPHARLSTAGVLAVEADHALTGVIRRLRGDGRSETISRLRAIVDRARENQADRERVLGALQQAREGVHRLATTTYRECARTRAALAVVVADIDALLGDRARNPDDGSA